MAQMGVILNVQHQLEDILNNQQLILQNQHDMMEKLNDIETRLVDLEKDLDNTHKNNQNQTNISIKRHRNQLKSTLTLNNHHNNQQAEQLNDSNNSSFKNDDDFNDDNKNQIFYSNKQDNSNNNNNDDDDDDDDDEQHNNNSNNNGYNEHNEVDIDDDNDNDNDNDNENGIINGQYSADIMRNTTIPQNQAQLINDTEIKRIYTVAKSRGNFAALLVQNLYAKHERITSNVMGTRGKRQLSPNRMDIVKKCTFKMYPALNDHENEILWKKECIKAIDSKNRKVKIPQININNTNDVHNYHANHHHHHHSHLHPHLHMSMF